AHVSKCPNEQVGRMVPIETRANVALAGTFGYELDMTRLPEEEKKKIPGQIARYHRFHGLVAGGDYYRLNSWCEEEPWDCWENVSEDRSKALITYVQVLGRPNMGSRLVRAEGLDPYAVYHLTILKDGEETEMKQEFPGSALMHFGLRLPALGDFQSALYYFEKTREEEP
ncbi:MAG: GH36 C-terminal domain-containing protein, partial [Lachnospira sp.]|nr:GH36 C-terminal domain-containing protein [Lachnospira sp.]